MVSFYVLFRYSGSCSAFGLEVPMNKKHFTYDDKVIVTDRGSEFTDPMKIDADPETGEIQCRVFYCDPMNSNQKSNRFPRKTGRNRCI